MQATKHIRRLLIFVTLIATVTTTSCKDKNTTDGEIQEVGYLMDDATGLYFFPMKSVSGEILRDLKGNSELIGIKILGPDSLSNLNFPSDTLTNLHARQNGLLPSYWPEKFTPVSLYYKIDTTIFIQPEDRHTISYPFAYNGGALTITYTRHYIQVIRIAPFRK